MRADSAGSARKYCAVALMSALTGCAAISPPLVEPQVAGFAAHIADELAKATRKINCYNFSGRGWTV